MKKRTEYVEHNLRNNSPTGQWAAVILLAALIFCILLIRYYRKTHFASEPSPPPVIVDIQGDVNHPGVYVLTDNETDNAPFVNEALSTNLPAGKYVFDDFISGILHHKVAIIDVTQTDSDPQVITGSHNWSTKANEQNDENTLIIHCTDLANQYLQEFAYRFQHNNGNLIVGAQIVETPGLSVFPNPSSGQLHIKSGKKIKTIQLFSLRGDKIRQWNVASEYEVNLHLPAHLSGMFILKVTDDEATSNVFKLIKK